MCEPFSNLKIVNRNFTNERHEQVRNQLAANLFEYLIFQSRGSSLHYEAYGDSMEFH